MLYIKDKYKNVKFIFKQLKNKFKNIKFILKLKKVKFKFKKNYLIKKSYYSIELRDHSINKRYFLRPKPGVRKKINEKPLNITPEKYRKIKLINFKNFAFGAKIKNIKIDIFYAQYLG